MAQGLSIAPVVRIAPGGINKKARNINAHLVGVLHTTQKEKYWIYIWIKRLFVLKKKPSPFPHHS
jgi:hypothetical protein